MAASTIDYDALAQQHGAVANVDFDALAAQHGGRTQEQAPPSTMDKLAHGAQEFWNQVNPISMAKGLAQAVNHPIDTYTADAAQRQKILDKGKDAYQKGNYTEAAAHLLYGMLPLIGPNLERSGEQFQQGDISGGVGSSLGQGVAMAGPGVIKEMAPAVMEGAGNAASRVRPAVKAGVGAVKDIATPENIATAAGGTVGGYIGHTLGGPIEGGVAGATLGRAFGKAFGKRMAAPAEATAEAATETPEVEAEPPQTGESIREGLNRANANQPPDAYPPGAEPPAPAQPDYEPLRPSVERIIDDITPPSSPKNAAAKAQLEDLLRNAMGGQKTPETVSGVPIKNQPAAQAGLPEGFSPTESSALKGYKYNPESSEFEAMSKSGQHYVYGDVSPVQAEMFEKANSKGRAWNEIRNSNPLVAKVINGKRVPVAKTGVTVSPEQ